GAMSIPRPRRHRQHSRPQSMRLPRRRWPERPPYSALPVRHLGHDFAGAFHIARGISFGLLDEDLLRVQDIVRGIALHGGVGAVCPGVQAAGRAAQRYRVHALLLQWLELEPIELLAILLPEPGEVDALLLAARGPARLACRRERERFAFAGLGMRGEERRNARAA